MKALRFFSFVLIALSLIQCNDSSSGNATDPKKNNTFAETNLQQKTPSFLEHQKKNSGTTFDDPAKLHPFLVYTDSKAEVSVEVFKDFLLTEFRVSSHPEFVLDALIEKELFQRNAFPTDQEIQEILKSQRSRLLKDKQFLKELSFRNMDLETYLKLMYPRQRFFLARQKIYKLLCEEQKITPSSRPDLSWIREQLEKKFVVNLFPEEPSVLLKIGETNYKETQFKNYLLGQCYLSEMLIFALYETAKAYYDKNQLTPPPEQEEKIKETLKATLLKNLQSEEEIQIFLKKHGITSEQFEQNLALRAKRKNILFTTAAHIQTTDAVLESLFQTKYTEIFQSGDQLLGKNTSLVRYVLDKGEVSRLFYSQEKHKEILPDFIKEKMALLEKVRKDIVDKKITFVQAVGQYSEDLIEKVKAGGPIGLVDAYNWPKEFFEQVQKLNVGEISPLFQTDQGLFLIQVEELVPEIMITARHLLFTPPQRSEEETPESQQDQEEMMQKMMQKTMEEAQTAWETIQNSPNPEETFLEMIRAKKSENDGICGPIARNQIYKSYLKAFEGGKLGEIQPPFPTIQGVYIIQPLKVSDGRKCRQLIIPTQYVPRFNQFVRKEANSQIEAKMKEILDYLKSHNFEETATAYAGWLRIENLDHYKNQMEPAFEEQFPSMKKGEVCKPFWNKDLYMAYQIVDVQQISYQEAKPQLLKELLEAKEEPTVRTGPALAKLYPYQFTFYFPYQNKKLEEE